MMHKLTLKVTSLVGVLALAACSTQTPAPVVQGYGRHMPVQPLAMPQAEERSVLDDYTASYVQEIVQNYYVQQGDTVETISAKYGVSTNAILTKNDLPQGTILAVGQRLSIPSDENDIAPVEQFESQTASYSLTQPSTLDQSASLPAPSTVERPVVEDGEAALAEEAMASAMAVLNSAPKPNSIEPAAPKVEKKPAPLVEKKAVEPKTEKPVTHTVKSGENIFRIGLKYGVSQFDIMAANDIAKPESLSVGQTLVIPSKKPIKIEKIAPAPKVAKVESKPDLSKFPYAMKKYRGKGLIWPAQGKIIKSFGKKGEGVNNTGINILLPKNAPILASDGGKVIYSDSGLESYGNLILIKHSNGLVTAYAHNERNLVKRNEKVRKGQVIAYAGQTGGVNKTQLHFEVRKNAQAIDPKRVLPKL